MQESSLLNHCRLRPNFYVKWSHPNSPVSSSSPLATALLDGIEKRDWKGGGGGRGGWGAIAWWRQQVLPDGASKWPTRLVLSSLEARITLLWNTSWNIIFFVLGQKFGALSQFEKSGNPGASCVQQLRMDGERRRVESGLLSPPYFFFVPIPKYPILERSTLENYLHFVMIFNQN